MKKKIDTPLCPPLFWLDNIFKGAHESIPSLAGKYDSPIFCRTGRPGYIGRRNQFLGIDSWAP